MRRIAVVLLTLLMTTAAPNRAAWAGTLEVAPTTIELSTAGAAGVFQVVNRADYPVTFQVEAFDWTQGSGEDRLEPSAALQVSPPLGELAPGEKQVVRLRAQVRGGGEKAFRLLVSELPSPVQDGAQQVRVLLQFSVPVFAASAPKEAEAMAWRARRDGGDLILTATNGGARRVKLSGLTVMAQGEPRAVPGGDLAYVLAGASRSWRLPAPPLPPDGTFTVRAGGAEAVPSLNVVLSVQE